MAEHEKGEEHGKAHGSHGPGAHGGGSHEEHEGAPEWLISFADNVVLIMGFFVILLAMNMAKQTSGGIGGDEKMGGAPTRDMVDFVIAMRESFNSPVDPGGLDPREEPLRKRLRERAMESERSRQPEEPGKGKESQSTRPTDLSTNGGTVPFETDSDLLTGRGRKIAEQVAQNLKGQRFIIEVRGHASPGETMRNVERGIALGHARALAVARVLVSQGLQWDQLRIVSCGDSDRKVDRAYDEADRTNQRVEVIPTNEPAPDNPPAAPALAPPTASVAEPAAHSR